MKFGNPPLSRDHARVRRELGNVPPFFSAFFSFLRQAHAIRRRAMRYRNQRLRAMLRSPKFFIPLSLLDTHDANRKE